MGKINYGRLILGAIVAGIFFFIADGLIHGKLLEADHKAAITAAGKPLTEDPTSFVYFGVFDLGKGLVVMLLYAAARARFGPGASTAIWAGVVGWLAVEALPNIAAMPLPFYPKMVYWKWITLEIVPMIIGAILGAWVYKET
jgi:hypothetical protein